MIFVTVGMHTQSFHRLVRAVDEYAATADERVIMQIGHCSYTPVNADSFTFAPYEDIGQLSRDARVVVCHGATSILTSLQQGTPVIAVPRERRFGEHIDDHQVEFVQALASQGWITAIRDVAQLPAALSRPLPVPPEPRIPSLALTLRDVVASLDENLSDHGSRRWRVSHRHAKRNEVS